MNSKSLQVLKRHNYCVKVERIDDSHLKVTYPPFNIFTEKSAGFSKEYLIDNTGVVLDQDFIALPDYLRRVAIIADIHSQCYYLGIDKSLICFFDNDGKEVESIFTLTKANEPIDKNNLTREQIVYKMLVGEEVSQEEQVANFRNWKLMKGLSI